MSDPATIEGALAALSSGDKSATATVEESLNAIAAWEPHLNALTQTFADSSRQRAAAIDAAPSPDLPGRQAGQPLLGMPVAVKDLICTTEGYTTAASQMLEKFSSPYNATVVQRLLDAGAIIVGKANLDEFAMGSSNEYSAVGPAKNPWDTARVPGGSSGGSAAAVASGEALGALGTDTGGSIRLPAGFCGVVGLKPTYGRVSRFGVIAYASSFDQVGPFARTVKGAAALLEVIAGQDPHDVTASAEGVPAYQAACRGDIKGLRIGVPVQMMSDAVDPAVKDVIQTAIDDLAAQGAIISEVSLSLMEAAVPTYYVLVKSEASSNLARFDGLRYGGGPLIQRAGPSGLAKTNLLEHYFNIRGNYFGPEVKRSILMGTYTLSAGYADAWYKQASRVRTLIRQEMAEVFKDVDVIAGPVAPEAAFALGSKTDDPLKMYLVDLFMEMASVAGLPAMSVPAGFIYPEPSRRALKLPVGLQLIAPHWQEERLFQVGHAYEQAHDWWKAVPKLPA